MKVAERIRLPLVPAWLRWAAVFGVATAIFALSIVLAPPEQVAPRPEFLPLDKWRHFLAYATLAVSLAYAVVDRSRSVRTKAAVVFLVTVSYGLGLEAGQSLLPARYFGIGDVVANGIGAALGLSWYLLERRVEFVPSGRYR